MIVNRPSQIPSPAIIEPDYGDEEIPLRKRFKKICSSHPSKYSPIPCPPPVILGGLQHPASFQSPNSQTVILMIQKQRTKVKDHCNEQTESSSSNVIMIKRKRASTSPHNTIPLVKPLPLYRPLPPGRPLAVAPSLPRLATGRAIPKLLSLQ